MLLVVDGKLEQGFVHLPANQLLEAFQEVIREGNQAEGLGFVVGFFPGLEDNLRAFP